MASMLPVFFVDHGVGDVGILDAERAAEAAADLGVLHLRQRQPVDGGQQLARLRLDAELAQARAGVVIGDAAGIEAGVDAP